MPEPAKAFNILTYEFEADIVDTIEVPETGDEPPEGIHDVVAQVLGDTILPYLDGNEVRWHQEGDQWVVEFVNGLPSIPQGPGEWLPPYRTMEMFTGVDGSGDGLLTNLPDTWDYEEKNRSAVVLYPP